MKVSQSIAKKAGALVVVFAVLSLMVGVGNAQAATASDTITVNLSVDPTIAISSPADIIMGAITGFGKSTLATNSATWTVVTNNSAGYNLSWQSSAADMSNGTDTIAAYTPATAGTPEVWSVASADSEWGARLSSTSTTTDVKWGTDNQSGIDYGTTSKWHNVGTSSYVLASRSTETAGAGDSEVVNFGAEVGATHLQPTGTYTVNVTMTATTL